MARTEKNRRISNSRKHWNGRSLGSGKYLAKRMEEIRQAQVYGVRPKITFRQAAIKYLDEAEKASISDDILQIKLLVPFIGNLPLEGIHMGTLQPFIQARKEKGVKNRTINYGLQTLRHILNLAAGEWMDTNGLTWLTSAPRIKFLPESNRRAPYPLSWEEQFRFFSELPRHLAKMACSKSIPAAEKLRCVD